MAEAIDENMYAQIVTMAVATILTPLLLRCIFKNQTVSNNTVGASSERDIGA